MVKYDFIVNVNDGGVVVEWGGKLSMVQTFWFVDRKLVAFPIHKYIEVLELGFLEQTCEFT